MPAGIPIFFGFHFPGKSLTETFHCPSTPPPRPRNRWIRQYGGPCLSGLGFSRHYTRGVVGTTLVCGGHGNRGVAGVLRVVLVWDGPYTRVWRALHSDVAGTEIVVWRAWKSWCGGHGNPA